MINRKAIKIESKEITKHSTVNAYTFTFVFLAIIACLNVLDSYVNSSWFINVDNFNNTAAYLGVDPKPFLSLVPSFFVSPPAFWQHNEFPTFFTSLSTIFSLLISYVLGAGFVLYCQGVRKGLSMPYITLFDGFMNVGKIVCLRIIQLAITYSLSMLFFIPGLVAKYMYRFAIYNLLENTDIPVLEAFRLSRKQSRGYKMAMFKMDLSFLGWTFLSLLTSGIINVWVTPWKEQSFLGIFEVAKTQSNIQYVPTIKDDDFQSSNS